MNEKDKQKAIKQFYSAVNSIRYQIYSKHILTIGQAFKALGCACPIDENVVITGKLFNEQLKPIEAYVKEHGILPILDGRSSMAVLVEEKEQSDQEDWEKEVASLIPPTNKAQSCTLYHFQLKAAKYIWWLFLTHKSQGALLRGNTGDGKAFVIGQLLRWLNDINYAKGKTISPFKYLVLTKASIVEQTTRVFEEHFGLKEHRDFWCTNYDSLRSSFGKSSMIDKQTIVEMGEPRVVYKWKPFLYPIVTIFDEYHSLKNIGSQQSEIAQSLCEVKDPNLLVLSSSATPFSRVESAKVFCVSTRHKYEFLGRQVELTNDTWNNFAKRLASPADPAEFSKAAIKRLIKEFKPYIVTFKNVHRKHKSINNTMVIDFATPEDARAYELAWENYLKEKARIEGGDYRNASFLILVQFLKFRQAAEIIRARTLAKLNYEAYQKGYAVINACCFKPSIAKSVNYLFQDFNIPRDQISLIWGGDSRFTGNGNGEKDKEISKVELQDILARAMQGEDIDARKLKRIISQLQVESMGLTDLPSELDLGIQTREKRQNEIDKFQTGQSYFCFFTFQAGGAGLSLHHYTNQLRQRRTFLTPTYNEMEMEQGFGRAHRINSLSDTEQSIILYRGTIEERVLARMCAKKTCLDVMTKFGLEQEDAEARKILSVTAAEDEAMNEREFEDLENEE